MLKINDVVIDNTNIVSTLKKNELKQFIKDEMKILANMRHTDKHSYDVILWKNIREFELKLLEKLK